MFRVQSQNENKNITDFITKGTLHIQLITKYILQDTTLSWFVVKKAFIPCNGAPTGKRKSSSAVGSIIWIRMNNVIEVSKEMKKVLCITRQCDITLRNTIYKLKNFSIKSYHQFHPLCLQKCECDPSQEDFYPRQPILSRD